jgi:hypothetical protein
LEGSLPHARLATLEEHQEPVGFHVVAEKSNCIDDGLEYCWSTADLCGDCQAACDAMGDCVVEYDFCAQDAHCADPRPIHNICTCQSE